MTNDFVIADIPTVYVSEIDFKYATDLKLAWDIECI